MVELLKRWLRTHAASEHLSEDELRSMSSLCREVIGHPDLFADSNPRSFLQTMAEVFELFQVQLGVVLEQDKRNARLMQHILSLSKNLISDVFSYLLLGPTALRQFDDMPSMEIVSLWRSLPNEKSPFPGRSDARLQKRMREAWQTSCGTLIASLLRAPWCIQLFGGLCGEDEVAATAALTKTSFSKGDRPSLSCVAQLRLGAELRGACPRGAEAV